MPPAKQPSSRPVEPRVVLDDRERASDLHRVLGQVMGSPPAIERLTVGDILIARRWLVERKSAPDFVASIRDGRLASQTEQLLSQRFEPVVIVEGGFSSEPALGAMAPRIREELLRLVLDWRIPVFRSRSTLDTAHWVHSMLKRLDSRRAPPDWRGVTPKGNRLPQCALPPRPKRKLLAPDERTRREEGAVIAAMPGVGPVRARALMDKFGSFAALLQASIFDLAETPGIGPRIAETLWRTFHGPNSPPR